MFIDVRNLEKGKEEHDSQFEALRDIRSGYVFEVNNSVDGDRNGLVWFKAIDGDSPPFQVFYDGSIGDLRNDMFCRIERDPKKPSRWRIKEFTTDVYFDDQSTYEQLPSRSAIPAKEDYEWPPGFPGVRALNIFPRAITDFAVRPTSPSSMKVRVYSGVYPGAINYERFLGPVNTKDFTADVPGAGLARLVGISIDNSGSLNYYNGSTFVAGLPMPDAAIPSVSSSEMLISAVRLVNGMTAIEESNFDLEMRPLLANGTVNVKVSEVWEGDFGNVALTADDDGKIGIGIPTPATPLHILSDAAGLARLERATTADNFAALQIYNTSTGGAHNSGIGSKAETALADSYLYLTADNSSIHLAIKRNGNVGIGNVAPLLDLHVGPGTDTPVNSSVPGIFTSGVGGVQIAARETGSNIETALLAGVTGAGVGTMTNHDFLFAINNVAIARFDTNGNFGINTATIPHGAVGLAKLAIEGTDGSSAGPHVQFTTPTDDYPLFQQLNWQHDNISLNFDSYYDGAEWRASDTSSFQLYKQGDLFKMRYETSAAAGDVIVWNEGIVLTTAGLVGIQVTAPQGILHTYDTIGGSLIWEYDGLDATVRTVLPNGTGDCLYRLQVSWVLRNSAGAVASGSIGISNGASSSPTVGADTVRIRVNADGSIDIARTAGTNTIKVLLSLLWL